MIDPLDNCYLSNDGIAIEPGDLVRAVNGRDAGTVTAFKSGGWVRFNTMDGETSGPSPSLTIIVRARLSTMRALIAAEMAVHRAISLAEAEGDAHLVDELRQIDQLIHIQVHERDMLTTP